MREAITIKKVYERARMVVAPQLRRCADSGYQGTNMSLAHKKPRNGHLQPKQVAENTLHSKERVCVEHAIGKLKIWNILSARFPNRRCDHTLIFKNVAGLCNIMYA